MGDESPTRLGLFADGPVGEAVLSVLLKERPEALAYVVAPARSDFSAGLRGRLPDIPLLIWDEVADSEMLPRHAGVTPEIVLLAWWPHLVKRSFLNAGQVMTLNLHPSLLPYGRGKDPNFWAIAAQEPYGVTIHHVDETVDGGDIAFQAQLEIGWEDDGETLYARAQNRLIELFRTSLADILSLSAPRIPQDLTVGELRRRAMLEPRSTLRLDEAVATRDLLNLLRARTFPPFPGCRFTDKTGTYQVRIQIEKIEDPR